MQKHLALFIALFIGFSSIAQLTDKQIQQIDSLKEIISTAKHDTIKINALVAWDDIIYVSDPELDLELNQQIVDICQTNLKNKLNAFELKKFKKPLGSSLNNIGIIYHDQSNYEKALDYYKNSLNIKEELGDKRGMGAAYINIGLIHMSQGNFEKALEYFLKSLKIKEQIGDKRGMGTAYINIGLIHMSQGNFEKALEYSAKSLKIREELGDKYGMGYSYHNIGYVYYDQGNFEKALEYYAKSLKIREQIGDKRGMGYSYHNIGLVYKEQGNLKKALEYFLKAKKIRQQINVITDLDITSEALSVVYKKLGKYKQALEMHELYMETKDSIAKMNAEEELYKFEVDKEYQLRKQADSIEHANAIIIQQAENKVNNAQLAAEKAENKQHILEADQQKQQKYFLYGILALALLFGGFIFNRFRITNRQKKVIEIQKEQVEEKNKEILDSIQYAKRLQEAILPPTKIIKEYLPQSFIFYKPKDIVAGDFYWMESLNGWTFFAAADCTGHGVPGAMVSVVCSNALSKSVIEEKIAEPAAILNRARELVIERFGRSEKQIKDGMDISLCAYHSATGKVKWAGAHNPLWIIRAGSKEIEAIKADSQPIGRYATNEPFTAHSLQLNKGDTMYLFTDGFSDQFGGEQGKKYKAAKFKRFLLSIQDKDMDVQRQTFTKEFDLWKGNMEQIDDVCVMGVRV